VIFVVTLAALLYRYAGYSQLQNYCSSLFGWNENWQDYVLNLVWKKLRKASVAGLDKNFDLIIGLDLVVVFSRILHGIAELQLLPFVMYRESRGIPRNQGVCVPWFRWLGTRTVPD